LELGSELNNKISSAPDHPFSFYFFRLKGLSPRFHFSRKKPPVRYNNSFKNEKVQRKVSITPSNTTTGASQIAAFNRFLQVTTWMTSPSSGWALRNSREARPPCPSEEAKVLQVAVQSKSPHVMGWVVADDFGGAIADSP
jgi:hypothetical protein